MKIFKTRSETFEYNQVISCVDYFSEALEGQCHIYSYPYTLKEYNNITNNFPGGLFECVREISLFNERPFEHEFFLRIAQSFPLIKELTLINQKPQKNKQYRKTKDDEQDFSIVKYPHLTYLMKLMRIISNNSYLPYNMNLVTNYQSLEKFTQNFQEDSTRINCSKINYWFSDIIYSLPKYFKDYFLHVHEIR